MMQKLEQNFVYKSSRYNLECSSLPSRAFPELHRAGSEMALLSDVGALLECSSLPSRAFPEMHRAVSEMALLSDVGAHVCIYAVY